MSFAITTTQNAHARPGSDCYIFNDSKWVRVGASGPDGFMATPFDDSYSPEEKEVTILTQQGGKFTGRIIKAPNDERSVATMPHRSK